MSSNSKVSFPSFVEKCLCGTLYETKRAASGKYGCMPNALVQLNKGGEFGKGIYSIWCNANYKYTNEYFT